MLNSCQFTSCQLTVTSLCMPDNETNWQQATGNQQPSTTHATKFTIMESNKDNVYARWLEGQLSPEETEELQTSGELEALEAIINTADKLSLPKYDASAGYAKFKANRPAKQEAKVRPIRKLRPVLMAAASIAILIGVFWFVNSGPNTLETGNKLTLSHTFSDQTSVVLNDGSSLVYEEEGWETQRSVTLKGEAIFNVQKGKPFIVNTEVGKVAVLGTSFNVRAWHDNLNVECYEGRVQVSYGGKSVILNAREGVDGIAGVLGGKQTISHEKPLWATGNSKFYQEPINQVFKELERQYDVQVQSPKIDRVFNGSFQHGDLETALNNICKPMNLTPSLSADKKVIIITEN